MSVYTEDRTMQFRTLEQASKILTALVDTEAKQITVKATAKGVTIKVRF